MKGIRAILPAAFFMGFTTFPIKTEEERFWNWFVKNQEILNVDQIGNNPKLKLNKELSNRLHAIDPNLNYVLGSKNKKGVRELIISAQGVKTSFPRVVKLIEKSPKLKNWEFTPFLQRTSLDSLTKFRYPGATHKAIVIGGDVKYIPLDIEFSIKDIFFQYSEMSKQLDIRLYIRDYIKNDHAEITIKRLLNNLLGEYDLETEIDWITYLPLNKNSKEKVYPILRLRELVDQRKLDRKKV